MATVVLAVAFATTLTPVNVEAEASIVSIVVGCEECGVARARVESRAATDRPIPRRAVLSSFMITRMTH